jgi:hypothetical protein
MHHGGDDRTMAIAESPIARVDVPPPGWPGELPRRAQEPSDPPVPPGAPPVLPDPDLPPPIEEPPQPIPVPPDSPPPPLIA